MFCRWFYIITLVILTILSSIVVSAQENASPVSKSFDFRNGALGWQAGFARYPPATNNDDVYELRAELRSLPQDLAVSGAGFYFQAKNHSDALVMFMKRRLDPADGIVPGQTYQVNFTLVFASNEQSGCGGIGGSPGDSVSLRAGASPSESLPLFDISRPFPYLEMNVDIGGGSGPQRDGVAASFAGTLFDRLPSSLARIFSRPPRGC